MEQGYKVEDLNLEKSTTNFFKINSSKILLDTNLTNRCLIRQYLL